ncbi:hypothetical protein D0T12_28895 [Actinomadura spongiicola]|uniref:Uncharacterized protein n=1 Tax=Actinomadura spongiicola TaxID=2303421 RepID=A0A372GA51_9ACTN|nr:hypothetical protein [Actinomadura spongiicola]RFS82254.1 hypothetical protein D0T12_28895 [Actinomadura spongiicola]
MSGSAPSPDRVDHIVFAWSERLLVGGNGLGPVATSLDRDALRLWTDRLVGGDAAVGQWHHGAPECVALGALRLGQHGVALRLLPARDANGRVSQLVHALIGPAATVDARLALGLHAWPGWVTSDDMPGLPDSLSPWDAAELREFARTALDAFPVRHEPLAGLLAGVLAAPTDRYLADIAPGDLDLVAGLVRRLGGVAGDEPWTMMLGATVTRPELRPRLLVSKLDDARRDRVRLTTAPTGDARLDRGAMLLAALPDAAPPPAPLPTPAALLDWVESEHQRATKVLDLIDRAIAGTLDDDARRHLDGPSGQDRMRAELRHVGAAEFADRLRRWAAGPPRGLGNAARTLRVLAAERYLAEARESRDVAEQLADAARRMDITVVEASRVLANWFGGLTTVTPWHQYEAVYFALWFGVEVTADPTVGKALHGIPVDDLLRWAASMAAEGQTDAALHFMRAAYDRWRRSTDRAGNERVRALLRETGTFHETIHRLVAAGDATAEEETHLYRIVLHLAYGAPIVDMKAVLGALPMDAALTEYRPWTAVGAVVERRDLVFQVAAHAYNRNAPPVVLEELLRRFSSADLILGLAARPGQPGLLVSVCALLQARDHDADARRANRRALLENGFLIDLVESAWQAAPDRRLAAYGNFIGSAYLVGDRATQDGAGLSVADVQELLALGGPPLFGLAVLAAAGADAVLPVLVGETQRHAVGLGLPEDLVRRITRGPHFRPPQVEPVPEPAPAPSPQDPIPQGGPKRPPSFGGNDAADGRSGEDHRHQTGEDGSKELAAGLGLNRNALISGGVLALVLALIISILLVRGDSDDDPPRRVTPTVTVTVTKPPTVLPSEPRRTPTGQND